MAREKKRRLGKLPPQYTFVLNPYAEYRFTRCPNCAKVPGLCQVLKNLNSIEVVACGKDNKITRSADSRSMIAEVGVGFDLNISDLCLCRGFTAKTVTINGEFHRKHAIRSVLMNRVLFV